MTTQEEKLVTVIIATYNSSGYILEALESVKNQTWPELELIVTDDFSVDDTVNLCREWLARNSHRFLRTEIVTTVKNSGVSANANRGLKLAKGKWIKFLGGDDMLLPGCVEDNTLHINRWQEIRILFSYVNVYKDLFSAENFIVTIPGDPYNPSSIMEPGKTAEQQYRMLLLSDRIHFTPSVFINRETLQSVKGFDERFRMMEDYPMWLKLTKMGYRLYFMDKVTVNCRRHSYATNNTGFKHIINPVYYDTEELRRIYTYPDLPTGIRLNEKFKWFSSSIFRFSVLNRDNRFNRFLFRLLTSYLNPFNYYIFFKRRILKNDLYIGYYN